MGSNPGFFEGLQLEEARIILACRYKDRQKFNRCGFLPHLAGHTLSFGGQPPSPAGGGKYCKAGSRKTVRTKEGLVGVVHPGIVDTCVSPSHKGSGRKLVSQPGYRSGGDIV